MILRSIKFNANKAPLNARRFYLLHVHFYFMITNVKKCFTSSTFSVSTVWFCMQKKAVQPGKVVTLLTCEAQINEPVRSSHCFSWN